MNIMVPHFVGCDHEKWRLTKNEALHGVHSNELGNFILPLMLRAFELTNINIHFKRPLACRSQLYNVGVGKYDYHSNKV